MIKDEDIGKWVPVKVPITYDWRSRSPESGNYISSVEFSNIRQEDAIEVTY